MLKRSEEMEDCAVSGALLVYFADDVAVRIAVGNVHRIFCRGIYGWQQLNEHRCRQRHREEFGK